MNRLYILLILTALSTTLSAQVDSRSRGGTQVQQATTRTISGQVVDEKGSPLGGANVSVVNTQNQAVVGGTVTDADGNYSLTIAQGITASLKITYVGYADQFIALQGNGDVAGLKSTLEVSDAALNEVVVVAYGTQLRQDVSSSQVGLKAAAIENQPINNFDSALEGRLAGVQIAQGSGKLGQGFTVRVRGGASINGSNDPLYVVDGFPITTDNLDQAVGEATSPLADINPNDIESIEVLKDAAATAIYGSRGSNGVVLINTKRGKAGKLRVDVNIYGGVNHYTHLREFLNGDQYAQLLNEATMNATGPNGALSFANGGTPQPFYNPDGSPTSLQSNVFGRNILGNYTPGTNTNWAKLPYRIGSVQNYEATISGGDEKTTFLVGVGYNKNEGILIKNKFDRASGRLSIEHHFGERFTVGGTVSVIRTENDRISTDNAFSTLGQVVAEPSNYSPYSAPGQYVRNPLYYDPLFESQHAGITQVVLHSISNIFAELQMIKSLKFRTALGIDIINQQEDSYNGRNTQDGSPAGSAFSATTNFVNYTFQNYVTWDKSFNDDHNFNVVGGFEIQNRTSTLTQLTGKNFPSDAFHFIGAASQFSNGYSGINSQKTYIREFARFNYNYRHKYIFSASASEDASSTFGPNDRYGFFPGASIAWNITEEDFLKNSSILSILKPRISYGKTGNEAPGSYGSRTLAGGSAQKTQAGTDVTTQIGNLNLGWESTLETNFGLDYGLFGNRITGTAEYYIRNTSDLLLLNNQPATSPYTTALYNAGKVENKGFDISVSTKNLVGKLTWTTDFNISINRSKVVDIAGNSPIRGGYNNINIAEVGQPLGVFSGIKYAGVNPQNGDAMYYKADNTLTNNPNEANERVIGDPNPKFSGGLANRFTFANFDLDFLFQFVHGNQIFNAAGTYMSTGFNNFLDNQTVDQLSRWTHPGQITSVPRAEFLASNGISQNSSRFVYDAAYVRLKSVSFGYNFTERQLRFLRLSSLRLYVSGTNLITMTHYQGNDPETNSLVTSNVGQGNDFYTVAQARTFIVGIKIGL